MTERDPGSSDRIADQLAGALSAAGLSMRGSFDPAPDDGVPSLPGGGTARTVVVIGNAGPAMWRAFTASRPAGAHPLDAWTRATLTPIAHRFRAAVVFPFDRPALPFQRWLTRADGSKPSPLGILVHPEYGLWHAVRGALLFERDPGLAEAAHPAASPCDTCEQRPCLTACPVSAFSPAGYDVARCVAHLTSGTGEDCLSVGCRARRACPLGQSYRYAPPQARHHMEAFLRAASARMDADASPAERAGS